MRPRSRCLALALLLAPALGGGCGSRAAESEIWIYTSIYPSVLERMEPALAQAFPGVRVRWYQKGSEQVAQRLSTELAAGATPCDLLMTSDPFYYAELAQHGLLMPYESPAAAAVPAAFRHPEHAYATVRIPLMVLGVNTRALTPAARPHRFRDLGGKAFANQVSMGDPLKSGTNFTTVAALSKLDGWSLIEGWNANGLMANGGNSAVIRRLETGERPVGIVLLENLLPRIEAGAPLAVVYPEDGAVPVPSPIAIMASTDQPELAKRIYDFMFGDAIQTAIVEGYMYSPLPDHAPPAGAQPWADLHLVSWTADFASWVVGRRDEIKRRFREITRGS